ncbi:hypothetical protein [Gracilibacillus sp. JCM 18860]|uniref:hypothetical protein n=1 Tax=Gracilibacillus sp. JCM 18860 TaxID=1306159 RepID=UPI000AE468D0
MKKLSTKHYFKLIAFLIILSTVLLLLLVVFLIGNLPKPSLITPMMKKAKYFSN